MSFIYNLADTWNAGGTTFNSILMNVSNGAGGAPVGAAASRVLNLQANSYPIFTVDVTGQTFLSRNASNNFIPVIVSGIQLYGADAGLIGLESYAFGSSNLITLKRAQTSMAVPANIISGNNIGGFSWGGYDGTSWITGAAQLIAIVDNSDWTNVSHPVRVSIITTANGSVTPAVRFVVDNAGNVKINIAAIATTATDGFLHIPTCAGQPTGVPNLTTGLVPMIFDTTNSQFWFYTGGAWKQPKTPAGAAIVTWQ